MPAMKEEEEKNRDKKEFKFNIREMKQSCF